MNARTIVLATLIAASSPLGCAHSTYNRSAEPPGELSWGYDRHLQATQQGEVVAQGPYWKSLGREVSCVSQARDWAGTAHSRATTGTGLAVAGYGTMLTGFAGGLGLLLAVGDEEAGLALLLGGTLSGATLASIGMIMKGSSEPLAVDAVNYYNDHYPRQGACREGFSAAQLQALHEDAQARAGFRAPPPEPSSALDTLEQQVPLHGGPRAATTR